jgi:hypothetical protein
MIINWDAAYEALPTSALAKSLIDDEIRRMKLGIRERMGQEHQFGPFTNEDTGGHIPGKTTVLGQGDATALAAVTNMQEGALYLLEDGTDLRVQVYLSSSWVQLGSADHLLLSGTNDDDHPGLLKKDGGIMVGDLDMGTDKIITSEATAGSSGIFTLYRHRSQGHPTIGSRTAITATNVPLTAFKLSQATLTALITRHGYVMIALDPAHFNFIPQVYAYCGATTTLQICGGNNTSTAGFGVFMTSGAGSVSIRIRREYII